MWAGFVVIHEARMQLRSESKRKMTFCSHGESCASVGWQAHVDVSGEGKFLKSLKEKVGII